MSRSEFDLRAALHDGEGDPVDADVVIAVGRARAGRRRNQWRVGAAAAVLVAGLIGVGAVVFGGNNTNQGGGARANSAARAPAAGGGQAAKTPSTTHGLSGAASSSASGSAAAPQASAAAACPATEPAPPAGSAGRTTAPMFAKPVADLLICSYQPGSRATPLSVKLHGVPAREFAASLEGASTSRPTGLCPAYVRADQRTIRILARSTDGTSLAPVVATLNAPACRVVVSNGSAVRYGWSPPVTVGPALRPLLTEVPAVPKQGSPARS